MKKIFLIFLILSFAYCSDKDLGKKEKTDSTNCALGYLACISQHQNCSDNCFTNKAPTMTAEQYCASQLLAVCTSNSL
ncbi:hypothetical protein [Leptospira interrogans]|uniref:hypothetical protein n=1 Tax=Leptospira interrogans TaxID=173 RepID=UPI0002BBBED5|nr:hypothetical protein [Leptospira interrogans]MCR8648451.1 hypothetical protein [Leptospira interrogans serovar Bataviae]OAM86119.1 hypothetical protein A1343_15920 [Leptospira interrogans serovar Bataviae]QOI40476.1 hypothetical protein Lepto1548_19720 [Leptospira interrogans serovar Bataviae]